MSEPSDANTDPESVDTQESRHVRTVGAVIYGVAMLVLVTVWALAVSGTIGFSTSGGKWMAALPGLLAGVSFMALNMWFAAEFEEVSSYQVEREHSGEVHRNAFYLSAAIFSLTNLMLALNKDMAKVVAPMIALTLFFSIVMVLAPVWVSDTNSRDIIILKHARTACFLVALGLVATAISLILMLHASSAGELTWNVWGRRHMIGAQPQQVSVGDPKSRAVGLEQAAKGTGQAATISGGMQAWDCPH